MLAVITVEEIIESMQNRIIENINSSLRLCGETEYIIERCECANREIAVEMGKEIAELYREAGYDVDIYEYRASNPEDHIRINISL